MEIRQVDLSKKPTWRKFGHQKGLQNQLQKGATHREINAAHRRNFAHFGQKLCFSPSLFIV